MKFKKFIPILLLVIVLICCVSAINAAATDDNTLELDENDDVVSLNNEEKVSESYSDELSEPQSAPYSGHVSTPP